MKNSLRTMYFAVAALVCGIAAQAQPALNIATVDLLELYESYWEARANEERLRGTVQRAEQEIQRLRGEGEALVEEYQSVEERSTSSMLTEQARREATTQLEVLGARIQSKQQELQQFVANTQRQLEHQRNTHQSMMMDKITEVALNIGRARGATLIIDTSGPTQIGLSPFLYADESYDITAEVKAELDKTRPVEEPEGGGETPAEPAPGAADADAE